MITPPHISARSLIHALALAVTLALVATLPARAQNAPAPATLLADSIAFDGVRLIASGSVEVLYDGARLTATRIIYARDTGALDIEGPLRLTQAGGEAVILADSAALDAELRSGILTSARLVLADKYQLAAARIARSEGRYTRLSKTVTSACRVCADNPTPLWEIRAEEVAHDSVERQIYFKGAQFRFSGVPLLYLPRLRIPDPTLDRATGLLAPEFISSSSLGIGVEVPYFITLGDHRDLTVAPFLTSDSRTLKLRYRQQNVSGDFEINGAVTSDDLGDGMRGYTFFDGTWDVGRNLSLGVHLKATSDVAYLVDYDFYARDRLPSEVSLTGYSLGEALDARLIGIRTLREAELPISDTLPLVFGEVHYTRDIHNSPLPGQLSYNLSASGHLRKSDADIDGMDVVRLGASLDWRHSHILGAGLKLDAAARASLDIYAINQNSTYDTAVLRSTQSAALRLSYPMVRHGRATELIEPFVQLGWAGATGDDVPNSDAQLVEFDEGNLLALTRYPGADRVAEGASATLGLRYTRATPMGTYGFTVGRVFSTEASAAYSQASGLAGTASDWLAGGFVEFDMGVSLHSRAVFGSDLSLTKWETRLDLVRPRFDLAATHAYVIADPAENRPDRINEIGLNGSVKLTPFWTASAALRHDLAGEVTNEARLGLNYQNECMRLGLKVSRRFSDTLALDPSTDYSLSVGFGAFDTDRGAARCAFGG